MNLLRAFKEISQYYDMNVSMMTPGGHKTTLVEAWQHESDAVQIDPNEYGVDLVNGIYYRTQDGSFGGMAYKIGEEL